MALTITLFNINQIETAHAVVAMCGPEEGELILSDVHWGIFLLLMLYKDGELGLDSR